MIVGILFDSDIKNGGSHQMSVNNLLDIKKILRKQNLQFIVLAHRKSRILDDLKIEYKIIKLSIFDYLYLIFQNSFLFKLLVNKIKFLSPFEKKIKRIDIKFVFFLFTSYKALLLQDTSFSSTVFDTCHKDFPEFFETKSFNIFYFREFLNKIILPMSSIIITESSELKEKIIKFYQLDSNRIISIPNLVSELLLRSKDVANINTVKNKYNLNNNFYFYPAQFWSHKNHLIILRAIKKMKEQNKNIYFVFCGHDKGHLRFIVNKIKEYKIIENIKILGHLPETEIIALYLLSDALVMPTYFGPTNIPPLEAWHLKIPVVYSSYLRNHGDSAALYFNPNSEEELILALNKLQDNKIRKDLIFKGEERIKLLSLQRSEGLNLLSYKLEELKNIIQI
jgi:glycosyltransferase involved in cell wall biosynthesis